MILLFRYSSWFRKQQADESASYKYVLEPCRQIMFDAEMSVDFVDVKYLRNFKTNVSSTVV